MKFAYYPGCTAKGSTREADLATRWLARKLGIELVDLVDAGCCGSCEIKAVDPALHFMLNARILAMAAELDLPILTICDTCQSNLLHTSHRMQQENDAKRSLVERLKGAGVRYGKTPRVLHLASVLHGGMAGDEMGRDAMGIEALAAQVVRPLEGLRVAPFACCHAFRGPGSTPGSRGMLDALVHATGAQALPVRADSDCCGFHVLMTDEAHAARVSSRFLARCVEARADCIVTTSPLCHTSLDIYQAHAERVAGRRFGVPVLHLPQLAALALGAQAREIGLDRHMVSAAALLPRASASA